MKRTSFLLFALLCFSSISVAELHAQVLAEGAPSVLKEDKTTSSYVYDLKQLIRKSKENIRNVNDKIKDQAVQKRNQQREQKAREYYEQAQKLTEEGRLDEARELYEKAVRITDHPEMKYYIKESEVRVKRAEAALAHQEAEQERRLAEEEQLTQDKIENSYLEAVSLYKQQRFKEAKEQFLLVDEMSPGYKAVKSYLQIVDQDLMQSEQQAIKDQRQEIDRQEKEAEIARLREKELWRKEIEKKEKDRETQLQKQAQTVYDEAIRLYQDRKYAAAKDKFQEVEWVVPDFKSTRSYLKRIDRDLQKEKKAVGSERQKELEKQRWEETLSSKKAAEARQKEKLAQVREQAEFIYQSAVALFDKTEYAQAQEKFEEVENLYPNFRATQDYLIRITTLTKTEAERKMWADEMAQRKAEKEATQKKMEEADQLFAEAMDLYKMGRLIDAKEKFISVDQAVPDYKSSRTYLKRIDDDIAALVAAKRKDNDLTVQRQELDRLKEIRDKADFAYNEAIVAYDNKNYEKAKAGFLQVEEIYPNYKKATYYLGRIDEDIRRQQEQDRRTRLEKEAEGLYAQAVALYSSEQFDEAKKKFVDVAALLSDYKQTAFYLERIDDDIIRKKEKTLNEVRDRQAVVLYNQALALYESTEYEKAKEKFLELEAVVPGYKETPRYLAKIDDEIFRKKEESEHRLKNEQADEIYKQALALYKVGDFETAKEKFVRIEVIFPDYKETPRYLSEIDTDIERQKKEAELREKASQADPIYIQALDLYKTREFGEAKKKFLQVQMIYPDYKETTKYLVRVDEDMRRLEERLAQEEKRRQAEALYGEALRLFSSRSFEEAKKKFLEVSVLDPAYKNIKVYLAKIDKDIREQNMELDRKRLARAEVLYQQATGFLGQNKDIEAYQRFSELEAFYPDYKTTRSHLEKLKAILAQKGISLTPVGKSPEQEAAEKAAAAEEARLKAYQEAVSLFKSKNTAEARIKFEAIEKESPDYRSTRQYLASMKQADAAKEKEEALQKEYLQAEEFLKNKNIDEARAKFQAIEQERPNYRGTRKYLSLIDAEKAKAEEEPVLKAYQEAEALFKNGKFDEARVKFQDVQKVRSNYRSTRKYLSLIDAEKAKAEEEPVLKAYQEAIDLFKAKRTEEARSRFQEIEKIRPDYRGTRKYLTSIEQVEAAQKKAHQADIDRMKAAEAAQVKQAGCALERNTVETKTPAPEVPAAAVVSQPAPVKVQEKITEKKNATSEKLTKPGDYEAKTAEAEAVYAQGVDLYKAKKYGEAKIKFDNANRILPKYKSSEEYLLLIDKNLAQQSAGQGLEKQAAAVQELSSRSSDLYRQIKNLASDKEIAPVTKTFSKIDKIIDNLEDEQERIAREMARRERAERAAEAKIAKDLEAKMVVKRPEVVKERLEPLKEKVERERAEEERQRKIAREKEQQELKRKQQQEQDQKKNEERELREKSEALFEEGITFFKKKEYASSRERLREALKVRPAYKEAEQLLGRIDRAESEAKLVEEENKDKEEIARLVEKANTVNSEALQFSQSKDYTSLQAKFAEMEILLKEIQTVKSRMQTRRAAFSAQWEVRADDGKKKLEMREKAAKMQVAADKQEMREKARKMFREGEMCYANGNYGEARVRFLEAFKTDGTLRAAKTYVSRIDRLISQRDYEEQKKKNRKETRDLERRQEKKLGLIPGDPADGIVVDIERARIVEEEGMSLYRMGRFKEARIKFEEALKIGDENLRKKAERYLQLSETAIENEKKKAERAKIEEERRYLETKKTEQKIASQRQDKKQQDALGRRGANDIEDKDAEVQRQLEVRLIEQQNEAERNRKLQEEELAVKKAEQQAKAESLKFQKISNQEKMPPQPPEELKTEAVKVAAPVPPAVKQDAPVVKTVKTEKPAVKALPKGRFLSDSDVREVKKFQKIAAEEKARQDRAERQMEALSRQKKIMAQQTMPTVQATVKPVMAKPIVLPTSSVILQDDSKAAEAEKSRLLKLAVEEEKRLLNQQRAAIQKDFESGVQRLYNDAVDLFNKQLYQESREAFLEVQGLLPGYKKSDDYLKQISQKISLPKEVSPSAVPPVSAPVDAQPPKEREQVVTQMLDRLESIK